MLGFCCRSLFSGCGVQASHCGGFSCCGAWAIGQEGSVAVVHAWASLLHSVCSLPGPGIELMSLALSGGFFTPEPPGKPLNYVLILIYYYYFGCSRAGGVLDPWPGMDPSPPSVEVDGLNHWTTTEVQCGILKKHWQSHHEVNQNLVE